MPWEYNAMQGQRGYFGQEVFIGISAFICGWILQSAAMSLEFNTYLFLAAFCKTWLENKQLWTVHFCWQFHLGSTNVNVKIKQFSEKSLISKTRGLWGQMAINKLYPSRLKTFLWRKKYQQMRPCATSTIDNLSRRKIFCYLNKMSSGKWCPLKPNEAFQQPFSEFELSKHFCRI